MDQTSMDTVTGTQNAAIVSSADTSIQHGGATILLVEDEAFVRGVTLEVLEAAGYQMYVAKSAADAQRIAASNAEIDLLLTDVMLPGATGYALARMLQSEDPNLKILYITGYPQFLGIRKTEHEDCLPKPFSTSALLQRVSQLLDQE